LSLLPISLSTVSSEMTSAATLAVYSVSLPVTFSC
jgi:hypothetical protein